MKVNATMWENRYTRGGRLLSWQTPFWFVVFLATVCNPATGADPRQVASIPGFKDWVVDLRWHPDGKRLACGSYESVVLWSLDEKQNVATLRGISGYATSLLFLADGQQLLVGSYQRIQQFDLKTGKVVREFRGHRGQVTGLALVDDHLFLSVSDDQSLRQWTFKGQLDHLWEGDEPITALAYAPEQNLIALSLGDETRVTRPGELVLLNREEWTLRARLQLHRSAATDVLFSLDGLQVLTSSFDETVIVTRIDQPEPVGIFKEHSRPVNCLAAIPGTGWIVTGSGGRFQKKNELKIWKQATGQVIFTAEPHAERISCLALSPDGKYLATGSHDKTAAVFELQGLGQ